MNFMIYKLNLKKAIKSYYCPCPSVLCIASVLSRLKLIIKLIMNAILDLK